MNHFCKPKIIFICIFITIYFPGCILVASFIESLRLKKSKEYKINYNNCFDEFDDLFAFFLFATIVYIMSILMLICQLMIYLHFIIDDNTHNTHKLYKLYKLYKFYLVLCISSLPLLILKLIALYFCLTRSLNLDKCDSLNKVFGRSLQKFVFSKYYFIVFSCVNIVMFLIVYIKTFVKIKKTLVALQENIALQEIIV